MLRRRKIPAGHIAVYAAAMFVIMVVLPYACIKLFPSLLQPAGDNYQGEIPKTVKLYLTEEERYERIPFERYIQGVVAAEMPESFEDEALKAQAVASRTYALGRINAGSQLCDSVHCQAYRSTDIDDKVKDAVIATRGQVLLYNEKLAAHALYFSSSAGNTENSQDVFSGEFPYLVSVDSSNEPGATHKVEKLTLSTSEFTTRIKDAFPERNFGKINPDEIKVLKRTKGGRVGEIKVGEETLSGTDLRAALSLYSTRVTVKAEGDELTFTTAGSGHGVGMSQYGANGMAKDGKDFHRILSHYYQGTTVSRRK